IYLHNLVCLLPPPPHFFLNDTPTPEIYTLSLHDALPICMLPRVFSKVHPRTRAPWVAIAVCAVGWALCLGLGFERLVTIDVQARSEEHTSELQSLAYLVCRLLLEKKNSVICADHIPFELL